MILVCAATRAELRACEKGISAAQANGQYECLLTGVGPLHAGPALVARLEKSKPDLVVSSGFAGTLTAGIEPMEWISASRLGEWVEGRYSDIEVPMAPSSLRSCALVSTSILVDAPEGNAIVAAMEESPIAVDMESAALARACLDAGVAFTVARVVSDTPTKRLPGFLTAFTSMMAAPGGKKKIGHALRGIGGAVTSPREVVGLVKSGTQWVDELSAGWTRLATRGF